jgi:RNA polymerase sigma-70 factor, ECF subfamily
VPAAANTAALAADALERFRRGDREAFLTVYEAHVHDVRSVVHRFLLSPFEREEAMQEVWLQVYRMCHLYDPARGAPGAWLRAVAVNRCREILRARGRRPDPRSTVDEEALAAPSDPHADARAARVRQAVARFSGGLAADEAIVLRLALLEERPLEEVARAVGASVRHCKYLRLRLLARAAVDPDLRDALGEVES